MTPLPSIIDRLCAEGLLQRPVASRVLVGGTHAPVTLLEDGRRQLVIKMEAPEENRLVAAYLHQYREIDLLPELVFLPADASYLAYAYIAGEPVGEADLEWDQWCTAVDQVICRAHPSTTGAWGSADRPQATLTEVLRQQFDDRTADMDELLGAGASAGIRDLIDTHGPALTTGTAYRLHGDLGAHNLIVHGGEVVGLIDPLVVDSLPVLEVLFLAASTPHPHGLDGVLALCCRLPSEWLPPSPVIRDLYRLTLSNRIDTCRRHHPQDLDRYLQMYREL